MTDRELLELAAKAAGIDWFDEPAALAGKGMHLKSGDFWNPLTDDGDALRLAVKLSMNVYPGEAYPWNDKSADYGPGDCCDEDEEPDTYAATRRAIVRAAAAIGASK